MFVLQPKVIRSLLVCLRHNIFFKRKCMIQEGGASYRLILKWLAHKMIKLKMTCYSASCKYGRFWINCQVIYQTLEAVFHHISKHWAESWKYDAPRCIFDEIRVVWKFDETLSRVFDISSQSKLKQRSKRRNKIVKNYANEDHISKPWSLLWFLLF